MRNILGEFELAGIKKRRLKDDPFNRVFAVKKVKPGDWRPLWNMLPAPSMAVPAMVPAMVSAVEFQVHARPYVRGGIAVVTGIIVSVITRIRDAAGHCQGHQCQKQKCKFSHLAPPSEALLEFFSAL